MKKISGNKLFVKALKEEGVDVLFGYPGACTIDISDELYKQDYTRVILPRHEQALVHAADAYARSTGKVGVCLVTSGPGATNLVTGIATANYDSVPLVCFTGQVARHLIGNDAGEERYLDGVAENVLAVAGTVLEAAEKLNELAVKSVDACFKCCRIACLLDGYLNLVAGLFYHLLNACGMDTSV